MKRYKLEKRYEKRNRFSREYKWTMHINELNTFVAVVQSMKIDKNYADFSPASQFLLEYKEYKIRNFFKLRRTTSKIPFQMKVKVITKKKKKNI